MTQARSGPPTGNGFIVFASVFVMLAMALIGNGLWVMYSYDGGDGPVGGDAYNYIFWAQIGAGWICAGVGSAAIGAVLALIAVWKQGAER